MKVEAFKIKGWKDKERGVLIDENEDWVLVQYVSGDYIIDGYRLFRKKFIESRTVNEDEIRIARVLHLKKVKVKKPKNFKFGKIEKMLAWSEKRFGLFEFQDDEEKALFYGKINEVRKNKLIIDFVDANGDVEEAFDYEFSLKKIRSMAFETEYFKAIRLLMKDVKKD